ncbi:hypothetical protein [Nocardia sp. NPDC004260]
MTAIFRQRPTTFHPPAFPFEVENRYRCIDARHEGVLYNPANDRTYCLCGRVIRPGDCGRRLSPYERAEADSSRPDVVGHEARAYLDRVHGRELVVVPSECGDQYALAINPEGEA